MNPLIRRKHKGNPRLGVVATWAALAVGVWAWVTYKGLDALGDPGHYPDYFFENEDF